MRLKFILAYFLTSGLFAQDPYTIAYSIDDNLPTSNIYSVMEDHNGYVWFGSDVGVIRFDGYNFDHFSTDHGIGDNEVFNIFEDSQDRLWFMTLNGKLSFYKNKSFHNEQILPWLRELSRQTMVMDMYEDASGTLYFLFGNGAVSTLTSDGVVDAIDLSHLKKVFSIWEEKDELFALASSSIFNVTKNIAIPLDRDLLPEAGYRHFYDGDNYYFGSKNNIHQFINRQHFPIVSALPESKMIHLSRIDNSFWVGTRLGLLVQDGNRYKHYFKNEAISDAIKDSQGNYWVTSLTNGIKFIPNIRVFKHTFSDFNLRVNAIEKDASNNLWIGTDDGLFIKKAGVSNKDGIVTKLDQKNIRIKKIKNVNETVFVASRNLTEYAATSQITYPISVQDIDLFDGDYFLASAGAAYKFSTKDLNRLKQQNPVSIIKYIRDRKISNTRTNAIASTKNQVYLGTSRGLFKYQQDSLFNLTSQNEALRSSIIDLYYDEPSNYLFAATSSSGLIILKNDRAQKQIGKLDGLNSNGCSSIVKLNDSTYLIGTNKGLNAIVMKKDSFEVVNYNDLLNLRNEIINDIEIVDNQIYLATNTGLILFEDEHIQQNQSSPKVLINEILVDGLVANNLINLSHKENNITIHYTGISFKDYGKLRYEYKLNEESTWFSTNNRQVDFKDLAAKNYVFTIRAIGNNGVYSPEKQVTFSIKPPFWKNYWFIFSTLLLAFIISFLIIKKRIKVINHRFNLERIALKTAQEKTHLEKQMIDLEQKVLRLQMNPHFIFNALNTIKGYYSGGEIKNANLYISRFSKLLRLILDSDERIISLQKEIEMLELYIQLIQLRYLDIFEYCIDVKKSINTEEVGIPPLLLQPIVENAIIHGMAPNTIKGKLEITFSEEKGILKCTVRDNGVGFTISNKTKKSNHQSKAIAITKERITVLNKDRKLEGFVIRDTESPKGTEVIIKIPIIKFY